MSGSDLLNTVSGILNFHESAIRRLQASRAALILVLAVFTVLSTGCRKAFQDGNNAETRIIVTSDTILSGMVLSLLPSGQFDVSAIMPPEQCPGHYDMKLSDIQKVDSADLIVSFRDMPSMESVEDDPSKCILLDRRGLNWMAPDSYRSGLKILAGMLAKRFPEAAGRIADRCDETVQAVADKAAALRDEVRRAGIADKPVIASSMQREPLQWMGLRVIGDYGRPESMSVKEVVRLSRAGEQAQVIMVVDNLQSGPDAGRGIAEALGVPHVVLSNFPSKNGYLATLGENVAAVLAASGSKR
ncbi:MAG: zinc ABC transporter substrate-binding protein [Acidobacteria bacterium]|nr:zinc ABC transporter substrate-binding protein [Acidobacteriota bacterium]